MHNYDSLRYDHAKKICQTIDRPILVFDYFELSEMMTALMAVIIFQIIINSWVLMLMSLIITLGILPVIRRRNNKGIFFHWPYRYLKMSLPGIVNPKGRKSFSD